MRLLQRGVLVAVLLATGLSPGAASGAADPPCVARPCPLAGTVRWSEPLAGTYVVQSDTGGTVPAEGSAYAAIGDGAGDVAAFGVGTTVQAFDAVNGTPRW